MDSTLRGELDPVTEIYVLYIQCKHIKQELCCWRVRLIGVLVLFQALSSWILCFLMTSPSHPLHPESKVPSLRMRRNPRYEVWVMMKRVFKKKDLCIVSLSCEIHKNVLYPSSPFWSEAPGKIITGPTVYKVLFLLSFLSLFCPILFL